MARLYEHMGISVWQGFTRDLASISRRDEMKHRTYNSEGTSYDNAELNDDHATNFDNFILEARQLLSREGTPTLSSTDWMLIGVALAQSRERAVNIAYSPDHEMPGPITDHFQTKAKDFNALLERLISMKLVPDK